MKERGVLAWVGLQLGDSEAPDWPPGLWVFGATRGSLGEDYTLRGCDFQSLEHLLFF